MSLQKSVQFDLTSSKVSSPFLSDIDHGRLMVSPWTCYETEAEINELVLWLQDDDPKERDLRDSILCWKRLRFGNLHRESPKLARNLVTKAAMSMEKRYGPCIKLETETLKKRGKKTKVTEQEKLCRCECLESILPSMIHCLICHKTFANDDEFEEHAESKCIPYSLATEEAKEKSDSSKATESMKSDHLRLLKTILLDMDVALPEEALRPSKSHPDRRRAWRAFVKSAQSIFELVQAAIVVEDMIKTEYLKNEWWYWSSLSAAAKISTLSALSVRLFSLDAAIMYYKSVTQSDPMEETKPMGLPEDQKSQPVSDTQERSSRSNRRSGKKRKEPEGS